MIRYAGNIVEHPELIAGRITRFANLVGRENVIAGDCGLVVWAKLRAMVEGAPLAREQLWHGAAFAIEMSNSFLAITILKSSITH